MTSILFIGIFILGLCVYFLYERVSKLEKHMKDLKSQEPLYKESGKSEKTPEKKEELKNVPAFAVQQTVVTKTAFPLSVPVPPAADKEQKNTSQHASEHENIAENSQLNTKPQQVATFEVKEPAVQKEKAKPFNWELFTGIKLFAWIGGFAAFLGIVFFVKYSIDSGLLTPLVRVYIGFVFGVAALTAGIFVKNKKIETTSAVLAAIGIVFLYVTTYGASVIYGFMGNLLAYCLMILISATAFAVSVEKNAKYIAFLAGVGGYLTPLMLSTGSGAIEYLAIYMAMLTITITLISFKKNWAFLSWLSTIGVFFILCLLKFQHFIIAKPETMAIIISAFCLLFMAAAVYAIKRREIFKNASYNIAPFLFVLFSLFFVPSFFAMNLPPYLPVALLGIINAALLVFMLSYKRFEGIYIVAGAIIFCIVSYWTLNFSTGFSLSYTLAMYFIFFIFNGFIPVLAAYKSKSKPSVWYGFAPALLLFAIIIYVIRADIVFAGIWFIVVIAGFFALSFSVVFKNILLTIFSAFAMFATILFWLVFTSKIYFSISWFVIVLLTVSVLLCILALFLQKKSVKIAAGFGLEEKESKISIYPVFNLYLLSPFILLCIAMIKARPVTPDIYFASGLIISVLIFLLSFFNSSTKGLPFLFALLSMFIMQLFWHIFYFKNPMMAQTAIYWYFSVFVFFFLTVFLFRKRYLQLKLPWFTSALAGFLQGILIYYAAKKIPALSAYMGAAPAVFALIYSVALVFVLRLGQASEEFQKYRMALFANFILLFITLIFPAQLKDAWITVAWALEGLVLVCVYRFILPYNTIKGWGFWVLLIAFLRFIIPVPSIFSVSAGSIMNGYLYTYAIVIVSMFSAAFLWKPKKDKTAWMLNNRSTMFTGSVLLLFVLLNIEIAAFFSYEGIIRFQLTNSFAQDMSYTLCWGIFAIALFVFGAIKYIKAARLAGLALLLIATVKLFLHDLWSLGQIYRIGSLFGLAAMLILVSFLYQKYISRIKS